MISLRLRYTLCYVVFFLLTSVPVTWSKKQAKFYIYDWPAIVNRYANYTDRNHHGHGVEFPQWMLNHGAGRLISKQDHLYKTSQFALFKIMYERALLDPRRTLDPKKASSFLIPYDFGMDATFTQAHGRMRRTQCPLSSEVLRLLTQSTHFQANHGHDHTLIVSVNQNMNYFFNAKPCIDMLMACWNCTKLAIDEYMFIAHNRNFELRNRGINWHAVPFPSDYHYDSSLSPTISSMPPWEQDETARPVLVSFVGNIRKFSTVSTSIREALHHQCSNHSECSHGTYRHDIKANVTGSNVEARNAVFCLQPPGDMPSRKSVFDVVLSGCIPVFFHPLTARLMYEWHLGQVGWEEIGIHFDSHQNITDLISNKVDFIDVLIKHFQANHEDIRRRRKAIKNLAFQLQYSLITAPVANHHIANGRQQKDAYEVSMEKVLEIHSGRASHDRKSSYAICEQIRQHGQTLQTAEWCNLTHTNKDPFKPPSTVSYLLGQLSL